MNRRDSLKFLGFGAVSATVLVEACKEKTTSSDQTTETATLEEAGRQPFEVERDKKLKADKFFTEHEMATITVLADIIIPKDEISGSATDAGVPDFIEFIVKDIPNHQLPMRGGLRWLDMQCLKRYNNGFKDCTQAQQIAMVTDIAYPQKAKPEMKQGVVFFSLMRDLTASGFFTSKIGIADIGYKGNAPGKWDGVPPEVLKQYGLENYHI